MTSPKPQTLTLQVNRKRSDAAAALEMDRCQKLLDEALSEGRILKDRLDDSAKQLRDVEDARDQVGHAP